MKKILIIMIVLLGSMLLVSCSEEKVESMINFESNGGSEVESVVTNGESVLKMPNNPTREGYNFAGWFWDDQVFSEPFTIDSLLNTSLNSDMTVYAKWTEQGSPDEQAPVITGVDDTIIALNEYFSPLDGVVAIDDVDGDVTQNITYTGVVDITTAGSYVIRYRVMDSSGNVQEESRRVTVEQQGMSDMEKVLDAKGVLLLGGLEQVKSDLVFPVGGTYDTTITWESSHPSIISINGQVTRPAHVEGNTLVTLTATISLNDASATKVFVANVIALDPETMFTSVTELHESSEINDIVVFQGIVSSVFNNGYFLTDGTNAIGVYGQFADDVNVGDEIYVKGIYASYYNLYQLTDLIIENIMSTGNTVDLPVTDLTIADLLALDSSNKLNHGQHYNIVGTVELRGEYDNIWLYVGDQAIAIYYNSSASAIAALESVVGETVKIEVVYYVNHPVDGVRVVFQGDASDITLEEDTTN